MKKEHGEHGEHKGIRVFLVFIVFLHVPVPPRHSVTATSLIHDMSWRFHSTPFHFQSFNDGLRLALSVARKTMSTKRIRVLVAEDDEASARVARTILERLGCLVDLASNGKQALEYFRQHAYDLVLMDWQMPVMDGIEATARIRSMPRGKITPIVGTTSHTTYDECLAVGMNDVVPKPFVTEKLLSLLTRWTGWPLNREPDSSPA
jgi:CheY-like chemotaxis protein